MGRFDMAQTIGAQASEGPNFAGWCLRCRGRRIVGALGFEAQAAAALEAGQAEVPEEDCLVCEGAFADVESWLAACLEAARDYEFSRFQIGALFPSDCEAREKERVVEEGPKDTLRTEANRLLAPMLATATGAELDLAEPEAAILLDTRFWTARVDARSVYIKGRYTKTRRDIPQTHWPCKTCQGRGCFKCDDEGVLYASSVEDEIGRVLLPAFAGESYSFHGAGREDIDALMLGTGRPFVLEVKSPRKRTGVDLAAVAEAINESSSKTGVGVNSLHMVEKAEVATIKAGAYDKTYLAHCVSEGALSKEAVVAAAASMEGVTLQQRTPERVSHRRADLVRERKIHRLRVTEWKDDTHFTLEVHADSGAYIKELVSGDDGRTEPSFSAVVGVPCVVEALDVCGILDEA